LLSFWKAVCPLTSASLCSLGSFLCLLVVSVTVDLYLNVLWFAVVPDSFRVACCY
jgi:hypothetical protein